MEIGDRLSLKGYISQLHFLAGKPASKLETLLGYKAGRLAGGWALLALTKMPKPEDFEFRGYSYFSGGVAEGHEDSPKDKRTMEIRLKDGNYDIARLKAGLIAETFQVNGNRRLVKVLPKDPPSGKKDYPPGSGIPQWELVRNMPFKVIAVMVPEGRKWEK